MARPDTNIPTSSKAWRIWTWTHARILDEEADPRPERQPADTQGAQTISPQTSPGQLVPLGLTMQRHHSESFTSRGSGAVGNHASCLLSPRPSQTGTSAANPHMAMVQNHWYHFGIGAPPAHFSRFFGDWDVHWGYGTFVRKIKNKKHGHMRILRASVVLGLSCKVSHIIRPELQQTKLRVGSKGKQESCSMSAGQE